MATFAAEKEDAVRWVDEHNTVITEISDRIWLYAEPIWGEYRSSKHLIDVLRKGGFKVEEGLAGLDTGFVGIYGKGSPTISTFAEYDSVEGTSQMPVPYKCPVIPGLAQGTFDMHHGLAAGTIGAALAVKYVMEKYKIPGTLKVFGTPAEKTTMGKNIIENEGLFDNLDACIGWHPGDETSADLFWNFRYRCNNYTRHTFSGTSVYNALPWGGRNAFHALELMDIAVHMIKESLVPVTNFPGIQSAINKEYANYALSSVPGIAQVTYVSRAQSRKDHEIIQKRLFDCANAAALALGVSVNNEVLTGTWEGVPNHVIANVAHKNIEVIGPPKFTEKDFEYGRLVQKEACIATDLNGGTPFGDMSIVPPGTRPLRWEMGSTDATLFSWKCPTLRVWVNYLRFGWPDWATSSWCLTNIAHQSLLTAAKIVAATIIDLFKDPTALRDAKEEFHNRTKDTAWYNPMPRGQPKPKGEPLPKEHYVAVIEAFRKGPKWEGWEPELSERMEKIAQDVLGEIT
jgi:aminobenzoyl-glutamate utilization protein B